MRNHQVEDLEFEELFEGGEDGDDEPTFDEVDNLNDAIADELNDHEKIMCVEDRSKLSEQMLELQSSIAEDTQDKDSKMTCSLLFIPFQCCCHRLEACHGREYHRIPHNCQIASHNIKYH